MTTPGGQLTPGDEPEIGDPPAYGVPEGAYVGDAGSPQSFKDLNTLNESEAKRRMQQPLEGMFGRQLNAVTIFANALLGIVQGAVNLVVGTVQAVVDGIAGIFNAVGSLFGAAHRDTLAVDAARVAGENAIVANMSESLDQLDEIQRVGGAYMYTGTWSIDYGERNPHPIMITAQFPLAQGTIWHPPTDAWPYALDHYQNWVGSHANRGQLAKYSGTLELAEPGLWMIYFQAAVLQGGTYPNDPSDVWCYVSSSGTWLPVGTPTSGMNTYSRTDGTRSTSDTFGYGSIHSFGRAGSYVGRRDTGEGGGNTVSGYFMCYLETPGHFIHMSASAYKHFGGAASTFVFAQKVNSEDLRDDIEDLKVQIAAALPGQEVPLDLDDTAIAAMVAQAQGIEVSEVEVPDE